MHQNGRHVDSMLTECARVDHRVIWCALNRKLEAAAMYVPIRVSSIKVQHKTVAYSGLYNSTHMHTCPLHMLSRQS